MDRFWNSLDMTAVWDRLLSFLPNLLTAVGILIVWWVVYRITRRSLRALLGRAGFHPTLIHLLVDNVYRFALIVVAAVMAADQLGVNVAAALTGIGVAGIAIGFAAQDSLANMIAGFLIFWDKPFEVGDWVSVSDQYGQVRSITLRTTRIRTNNNTYVVIPNKKIIDEVLVNHSKHGETRLEVPIGIAYKEDIPRAREVLLEAIRGVKGVAVDPAPDVVVTTLGPSSVDLFMRVWIDDAAEERPVFFRTIEAGKLALDAAGIQIPYHHLQLFVDGMEDRVVQGLRDVVHAGDGPPRRP